MVDYRDLIKSEFLSRRSKNQFYSLRKFAGDLGLTPMHLSYLFEHQRGLSKQKAAQVATALGLRGYTAKAFLFLVSEQSGRAKMERALAKNALQTRPGLIRAKESLSTRIKK